MTEIIIGVIILIVIGIIIYKIKKNKVKTELNEFDVKADTVLPIPPKPPRDRP